MKKILFFIVLTLLMTGCAAPGPQKTTLTLIVGDNFKYEPASISAPAGKPVVLTLKNKGGLEHDFVIQKIAVKDVQQEADSMGMHHDMAGMSEDLHIGTMGGKSNTITFTPLETGAYEFFCKVKGHKEAGMSGTLVVTD